MTGNWRQEWNRLGLVVVLAVGGALGSVVDHVSAQQIAPDGTLPQNSTVTSINNNFTITGGTQVGGNLFHSFSQFSVPTGGEAFFNNGLTVQNIINRVTGSSISNIDGLLRANGSANLFLLNPNGIIFGPNASLNIGGSFLATTASSLNFADGTQFNAVNPQAQPLLTISVPLGLQFGSNPGGITNSSRASNSSGEIVGLSVQPTATLALVGGEVAVTGGHLTSLGGRVELGSVAANNTVSLTPTNPGWLLGYQGITNFQNVRLTDAANIAVNGDGRGSIAINGSNIDILKRSNLRAGINGGFQLSGTQAGDITLNASGIVSVDNGIIVNDVAGIGNGGKIAINAAKVSVLNGATITAHTNGQGNAGSIEMTASDDISINGTNTGVGSQVFANGTGIGGAIALKAPQVTVSDGAILSADTVGTGNGGKIAIDAAKVSVLNGATITAHTNGQGNTGSIQMTASDDISINGTNTGVSSQVFANGTGIGGAIALKAPKVTVSDGAILSTDTVGTGNGGKIAIDAAKVSVLNGATITAHTNGQGNAGSIEMTASDDISINGTNTGVGSQVFANGAGIGGAIALKAPKVTVSNNAILTADTQGESTGGKIAIDAAKVSISKASMTANTYGQGNAGSIAITTTDTLNAPTVTVSDGATITANTQSQGNAGSIEISAADTLLINGNGTGVGSQVLGNAEGNGGTIALKAPNVTVSGGANITANTESRGNAGSIGITAADTLLIDGNGTGVGSQVLGNAQGNGGTIALNAPKVTVSGGATVVANTQSQGNAGSIGITAADTLLIDGNGTGVGSQVLGNAQGNGGTIALNAPKVTVSGGATIVANTESQGNAGSIGITAADTLLIDGNGTGVGSQVLTNAKGNGGTIVLNVPQVSLSNGATITANNQGQGNAGGNIQITSRSIRLDRSSIVSKTTSGNGGNITLTAQDFLLLRRNSQISTTAGTAQAGGNGGRINIDTNFVIGVPGENSDITANAFSGEGGKVTINASGIFFVEPQSRQDLQRQLGTTNPTQLNPSQLPTNDITAISQQNPNLSGQVSINTPILDPSKGLVALPILIVDTSGVIETSNCAALNDPQGNTFTITGRGGLPPSPYEPLSSDVVWSDTRLRNINSGDREARPTPEARSASPERSPGSQSPIGWAYTNDHSTSTTNPKEPGKTSEEIVIVPATGWVFNGKGQVTLISHASGATAERLGTATSCIQP